MKSNCKAFTLIELLVVIAIIAILAAILFPVFAQAKVAAKAAASISNAKQIGLSVMMYSNDVDDMAPIETIWGDRGAQYTLNGVGFTPWTYQIMPYTKNSDIMQDPMVGGTNEGGVNNTVWYGYNPEYGYNYTLMSPWVADKQMQAASMSSFSRPAGFVMAANQFQHSAWSANGFAWFGEYNHLPEYGIEAPDCGNNPSYCWNSWGTNSQEEGWLSKKYVEGAQTGGVSIRKGEQSVTLFCDGHVKAMNISALAADTNWKKGLDNGALQRLGKKESYLWGDY